MSRFTTIMGKGRDQRRLAYAVAAVGLAGGALGLPPAAAQMAAPQASAAASQAGVWDLAFEKGNRRCRLFLRGEPRAGGFAIAMPPVCHHAFPLLATVTSWTGGSNQEVAFRDGAGKTVLDFLPSGTAALSALANETDTYQLMPVDLAQQDAVRMARVAETPVAAGVAPAGPAGAGVVVERSGARAKGASPRQAAAVPEFPPVTAAQVAGNYAVLRKDKDTGCMVTLEPGGGRARLAPACRDQGIVIFDPTGWQLQKGELVLTAKRGHTTVLTRREDKVWANTPARGAALVLKRL